MPKNPGWRTLRNRYNYLSRDLQNRAAEERAANKYRAALKLCLLEIEQFHHLAYADCKGGCPAHEAMSAAKKALGLK